MLYLRDIRISVTYFRGLQLLKRRKKVTHGHEK